MARTFLDFDRHDVRQLLRFARMNLHDRYLGSTLGGIWAVGSPLLLMALITVTFSFVMKTNVPGATTTLAYATWLVCGMGPWVAISDSLSANTQSVVASGSLVKNLAFKTELLPLAATLVGLAPLITGILFVILLRLWDHQPVTWHALAVLPVVALQFLLLAGLGFFLSAVNVFLRDMAHILPNLLTLFMFGTPIFYAHAAVPERFRFLVDINPFHHIIEGYRQPLIAQQLPGAEGMLYLTVVALALFLLGLRSFRMVSGLFDARL